MFKPISLFLGCRYLRAKSNNRFISFIALISMLGIALGVMVLITVLSIMNGFQKEIRDRMLQVTPHILVQPWSHKPLLAWQNLQPQLMQIPGVVGSAPYVGGEAMLLAKNVLQGVYIKGIETDSIESVFPLASTIVAGNLELLAKDTPYIILGQGLADELRAQVGNEITVILPQTQVSLIGVMPKLKRFYVAGIFAVDYMHDRHLAFMSLANAQLIFKVPTNAVTGIQLKVKEPFTAPVVATQITDQFDNLSAMDWTEMNSTYFKAVKTEKSMMFLILVLIIAVAAFNLVSTLVMLVTEKRGDIAILRALGASRATVMRVFVVQGLIIGLSGSILGVIFGVLLSYHVTEVVNFIEHMIHYQFLSPEVYFIDFLPSDLQWSDVRQVAGVAFILSFVATLYPAFRATQILPAEALRHD